MIEENRKYIETERAKATVDLKNMAEITNWENRTKTDGTAIARFYASFVMPRETRKLKLLTKHEKEFKIPVGKKSTKHKLDEQNTEDTEEDEFEFLVKKARSEVRAEKWPNKKKSIDMKKK